ncbi:MAG: hypothetical protein AMXMBFR7_52980 [Planctomycetota bacterium]
MVDVLRYLKEHRHNQYVVIFDDLKRFARDTVFHLNLRSRLSEYGALPECLNFKFEDTPEGRFVETVIAAQGELERHQIRRQTLQKMKARIEQGFYAFKKPVGYHYVETKGQGSLLYRDEPLASIIQEALEGYASGRFQIQAEVKRFFESYPEFPRDSKGQVRNQQVTNILTRPVYAGMVEARGWGVALRRGHHEPLISFETFKKIQSRLSARANVPARKDLDADFPLRGAVACNCCGSPLTACWSRGRHGGRFPYYLCFKTGCPSYRKSIRRDVLERDFEELVKRLEPSEKLFRFAYALFERAWHFRRLGSENRKQALGDELRRIESDVARLIDRIVGSNAPTVAAALERRVQELEGRKVLVAEQMANCGRPVRSFEESLRTALNFLARPWQLWSSGDLSHQRALLKLAFQEKPRYARDGGFRTPNLALPFKLLAQFSAPDLVMASPRGFEPLLPP